MPGLLARSSVVGFLAAGALHAQPITPQFRVNATTTGVQGFPSIARVSDKGYVVVWATLGGTSPGIFGRRLSVSGDPIGADFQVDVSTGYKTHPAVASEDSGAFVVVWSGSKAQGNPGIFGRRYSSLGVPLDVDFRINGSTVHETKFPSVAVDPAGGFFVVAWELSDTASASYGIFAHRYSTTGSPLGGPFRVDTATTGYQLAPSVSASSGHFVVVWTDASPSAEFDVYGRTYAADGTPTAGFQVALGEYTTDVQVASDVVMLADGSFVACWYGRGSDDGVGVYARRFNANGAPIGSQFRVNTTTTDSQRLPRIAADPLGNFVVVWRSELQDGSDDGVFGQRLGPTGALIGGEFRVNENTSGPQDYGAVATSAKADYFMVVFDDADGYSGGIWGRGYTLIGDANADGTLDVADVFYLINALFADGAVPKVLSDVNHDGSVDVVDVFYLINYLFAGGPPPV